MLYVIYPGSRGSKHIMLQDISSDRIQTSPIVSPMFIFHLKGKKKELRESKEKIEGEVPCGRRCEKERHPNRLGRSNLQQWNRQTVRSEVSPSSQSRLISLPPLPRCCSIVPGGKTKEVISHSKLIRFASPFLLFRIHHRPVSDQN
jgi:hypothetical protein